MQFIAPVLASSQSGLGAQYQVDVSLMADEFDAQDLIDVKLQNSDCHRYSIFDEIDENWVGDIVYDPARGILVLAYADAQLPVETAEESASIMERWLLDSLPIDGSALGTLVISLDEASERHVRRGEQPGLVRYDDLIHVGERIDQALYELSGEPYVRLLVYLRAHYMRGVRGVPRQVTLPWELASEYVQMRAA